MKILNLYSGIGGNRKLWGEDHEIIAIEYKEEIAQIYQDNFPNDTVIVTDAHQYLLDNVNEFDFIWSSPPCPTHSELRKMGVYKGQNKPIYPDMNLYQEIILLKYFSHKKCKWVVENVKPYYKSLIKPQIELGRHYFWTNFYIKNKVFSDTEIDLTKQSAQKTRYGFKVNQYNLIGRKDIILRNLVNPEIGLYLLDEALKGVQPIFNFDY